MSDFDFNRRDFFQGALGLAAGSALTLAAGARPTEASGPDDDAVRIAALDPPEVFKPTEDNILGPFHRTGAPYRAKITPPLEPGVVLLVAGRVWGVDTKKPLAGAVLDIWQANKEGRYDNDDPRKPPAKDVFVNRARLVTDETGYYEYETIVPGAYQIGRDSWRPKHIHYMVNANGYERLITQLYFRGDKHNKTDRFIKESLIMDVKDHKTRGGEYKSGRFDIVLARAK